MTKARHHTQSKMTNTIKFELFASRNENVKLLGSWNNWKPTPMRRQDNGTWCVDVDLADGEYEYQYQLVSNSKDLQGKVITIADPTALQYSPDSDTIDRTLLKIREGKRVLTSYQWQHDDVPLPPNDQLIIYELHLADFRGGSGDTDEAEGTFQRLIEKLDYLADLGINAIQLIPINETAGDDYWGYSQRSIYAVENTYGSPDDFCRLVDECHGRGIRVIHDAVFNHMNEQAPLAQMDYGYWFYEENPDKPDLQFGPKFNYEYHDDKLNIWPARQHVINAINLWINLFHIDGVRLDSTRAVKHYDLLQWFNNEMHHQAEEKPFYTIAEHLPQDPSITGVNGPVDGAWHDNFYRQMIVTVLGVADENHEPFVTDEIVRLLDARQDGFDSPYNTVNYLNNHDLERVMYLLGAQAHVFDDAAFRRNKLGASLLLTAPGIPMLWMGEEFGQATQKSEDRQPLDWSLLNNERNKGLWLHYQQLIQLRKTNPALYSENIEIIANFVDQGIIAFKRWDDNGNIVVVMANLKPVYAGQVSILLSGIQHGHWREAIYSYDVIAQDNILTDSLAESEVKIYINR